MIGFARQSAGPAHHGDAAKLTKACRKSALAGNGRVVDVKLHVTRHEKVQVTVMVVVAPRGSGRPASQRYTRLFGYVAERPIMIVVVQPVLSKVRNVNVGPAIVVVVAHRDAES